MIKYFVGVDSGGTKTSARLWIPEKNIKKDFRTGASNFCSVKFEEGFNNIKRLLDMIQIEIGENGRCVGIGIGAAGISNPESVSKFNQCLEKLGVTDIPVSIVSDAETALYGAIGKGEGIILISGTGSVCFGRNEKGTMHQVAGEGHLIGDEGSGYAIGRDILTAVVRQLDGRGEKTELTTLLARKVGLDSLTKIIQYVYGDDSNKTKIAAIAPLIIEAYNNHDKLACEIINKSINSLLEQVICVIKKLDMQEAIVAFSGSILEHMDMISERVRKQLKKEFKNLSLIEAKSDALDGALYLASRVE